MTLKSNRSGERGDQQQQKEQILFANLSNNFSLSFLVKKSTEKVFLNLFPNTVITSSYTEFLCCKNFDD